MAKPKKQTFSVTYRVTAEIGHEVMAESLEQALEIARKQDVRDVIDFEGEYNEGKIEVSSLFDMNWIR